MIRIHPPQHRASTGLTLIEMVVVAALLSILTMVTFPVAKYSYKRSKEIELRSALRDMRSAIDEFKRYSDAGLIPVELGTDGYPPDLETLVEGVEVVGQVEMKVRFLRRIPIDPMTGSDEWLLLSYQDEPDATTWGGENVFDVRTTSGGVGLNGVPYGEW